MAPVAEKDQHEPQWPWSLIGLTTPCSTQLIEAGKSSRLAGDSLISVWFLALRTGLNPRIPLYSSLVQSANLFISSWTGSVSSPSIFSLNSLIPLRLLEKIASLLAVSEVV